MKSPFDRLVALPCQLKLGAFSSERLFEVKLANDETYHSLAPHQFCWNAEGNPVKENEPSPKTEIEGMVAARIVGYIEDNQILVEVPDGEVIAVDADSVKSRPTKIKPPRESKSHVSV